jgi:hypothetical protein
VARQIATIQNKTANSGLWIGPLFARYQAKQKLRQADIG